MKASELIEALEEQLSKWSLYGEDFEVIDSIGNEIKEVWFSPEDKKIVIES